jgi:signal transduction histidine kinase
MLRLLRSRLAVRLAALFLLVSLAPIGGAAWILLQSFERSARAEVERRQRLLAERCAALVEGHVEQARAKLRTVGRLFAEELGTLEPERLAAPDARGRDALVARLQELVDPPDAFLELQFFAGGLNPQIVGQARQKVFDEAQQMLPDYLFQNTARINSNMAAPLVQLPLNARVEWRDEGLVTIEGYRTLLVSVPVSQPAATGALVAYVDFAPLVPQLAALAGAEYALEVRDGSGTVLGAVGSIEGPALEREVAAGGWSVRVSESAAPLAASLGRFRRQTWLFVGLAAAAAVAASLGLSAWITRPIARLERAAGELQRGNFAAQVRMERADEIGRLGAAFDRMAGALSELDRAKSEFVANVSHELRTPLTSLKLSVANLLDGVVGEVEPGQRAALERIQGELERLIRLVNQLLEMARLDAGAVEPHLERVELLPLAREVVESLRPLAGERAVELAVEGEGAVRADRGMLQRVLLNLLDNAIKFSPAGSRVRVELDGSSFHVRDSGPGIATSFAFEPFRQGQQHGVKNPGVGLGLAIVKKLVELNHGRVHIENASGAALTVELPPA